MSSDPPPPPPLQPPSPLQPLAPGNYDRAWNDPPLFSYSSCKQPGVSKLTKRVAFPPSSCAPSLPPGQDPTAPPTLHDAGAKPPPCLLPPPPSSAPPTSPSPAPPAPASLSMDFPLITEELEKLLAGLTTYYFEPAEAAELDKRFSNLSSSHRSFALGSRVPGLLDKLVRSLDKGDIAAAETSFTILNADHGGESGNAQWMVALRHLVNKAKEKYRGDQDDAITAPL